MIDGGVHLVLLMPSIDSKAARRVRLIVRARVGRTRGGFIFPLLKAQSFSRTTIS